jgi:hypothetical protein
MPNKSSSDVTPNTKHRDEDASLPGLAGLTVSSIPYALA